MERVRLYKLTRRITRNRETFDSSWNSVCFLSSKIYSSCAPFFSKLGATLSSLSSPRFPQAAYRSNFNAMVNSSSGEVRSQSQSRMSHETKGRSHETERFSMLAKSLYYRVPSPTSPSRTPWTVETVITFTVSFRQFLSPITSRESRIRGEIVFLFLDLPGKISNDERSRYPFVSYVKPRVSIWEFLKRELLSSVVSIREFIGPWSYSLWCSLVRNTSAKQWHRYHGGAKDMCPQSCP